MHECKPNAPRTYKLMCEISAESVLQLAAHLLGFQGHNLGLRGVANALGPISIGSVDAGTTDAIAYAIVRPGCVHRQVETS